VVFGVTFASLRAKCLWIDDMEGEDGLVREGVVDTLALRVGVSFSSCWMFYCMGLRG